MNELQVVVKQQVGKINWNFEELKTALAAEMEKYTGIVYDDDSIADAKNTVAYLRKLKDSVEERRKEVKKECLKPYDDMEILAYMKEAFTELPETVASKLKSKIYDSKWENKSTTKKTWQTAVNTALENTKGDLNILDGVEEDFREDAKKVYEKNLVLSEALSKVQELRKQKEMILERERQKREREEAAKREALAKKEEQPQEPKKAPKPVTSAEPKTEMGKAIESIERHAYQQAVTGTIANPVTQQPGLSGGKKIWTIQVRGNEEQHKKILDYIKFVGAEYRDV